MNALLLTQYDVLFFCTEAALFSPHVGPGCVFCPRIDPLRFLAGCRRRRLIQGLVVALGFFSLLDRACFCIIFVSLWVHAVFSLLSFCYQYQCNWLPGKIHLWNDPLCVEWDVKPCSTSSPIFVMTCLKVALKVISSGPVVYWDVIGWQCTNTDNIKDLVVMKVSKFLACSYDDSSWRRISRDVERMGAKCSKSCTRQSRRFVLWCEQFLACCNFRTLWQVTKVILEMILYVHFECIVCVLWL